MRPRLLDLFCGEGGASMGYHRAGFEVVGVDTLARVGRHYPFEFHQGEALAYVAEHGHEFDAIHASPPCQAYSITRHSHHREHPQLIEPTRAAVVASGKAYVIENVVGAPLLDPVVLCGSMFDLIALDDDGTLLRLERHRLFESNVPLSAPRADFHDRRVQVAGAYGGGSADRQFARLVRRGGYTPAKHVRAELLGIDWMTLGGLSQSIPPAYAEHIGGQVLAALGARVNGVGA